MDIPGQAATAGFGAFAGGVAVSLLVAIRRGGWLPGSSDSSRAAVPIASPILARRPSPLSTTGVQRTAGGGACCSWPQSSIATEAAFGVLVEAVMVRRISQTCGNRHRSTSAVRELGRARGAAAEIQAAMRSSPGGSPALKCARPRGAGRKLRHHWRRARRARRQRSSSACDSRRRRAAARACRAGPAPPSPATPRPAGSAPSPA